MLHDILSTATAFQQFPGDASLAEEGISVRCYRCLEIVDKFPPLVLPHAAFILFCQETATLQVISQFIYAGKIFLGNVDAHIYANAMFQGHIHIVQYPFVGIFALFVPSKPVICLSDTVKRNLYEHEGKFLDDGNE